MKNDGKNHSKDQRQEEEVAQMEGRPAVSVQELQPCSLLNETVQSAEYPTSDFCP